jgi:antibiotic biosynthesis monooxygenase (ABM) superfamily enzyme
MAGDGPVDLMEQLARPLPLAVICELLGLPQEDRPRFRRSVQALMSATSLREQETTHAPCDLMLSSGLAPLSSGDDTSMKVAHSDSVTSVIQHRVKAGQEEGYKNWIREVSPAGRGFPGYLGANFFRPPAGTGLHTVVLRFDTLENLQGWLTSESRRQLVAMLEPLLDDHETIEIETGLEFWFSPLAPAQRRPPAHKQFLLTLSAIFPLTVIVPWALLPLFQILPFTGLPIVRSFFVSAGIVGLMTYVIMPRYIRLVSPWLYR